MKMDSVKEPFRVKGKLHIGLLALFLAINLLVAVNAILHHPEVGYDANDHLLYMQTLPQRLPTDDDTREFFSPPLPYLIPSYAYTLCLRSYGLEATMDCRYVGGKTGQILNILLSLGCTFFVLKIAHLWRPDNPRFKLLALFFLGALPVYYKTFAQFWGQPYVTFFAVLATWQFFSLLKYPERISLKSGAALGLIWGLLILSRQWGFLVIGAILSFAFLLFVLAKERGQQLRLFRATLLALGLAFLVGSWFYFHLYRAEGKFTAFNRNATGFSFANKDVSFYRNTGLKDFRLFKTPFYAEFNNMFIPIFYSEIWGDYWGFFSRPKLTDKILAIWDWDRSIRNAARDYLGRVNLVSLYLTLLLGLGLLWGLGRAWRLVRDRGGGVETVFPAFVFVLVVESMAGYLWFVISYPSRNGDTIKAAYMLHFFVLLGLLVAGVLEWVRAKSLRLYYGAIGLAALAVAYNLPAMLTRYIYIR
jgi:4-amino-4-deoxy-L-arabinose transferase-like glycosyltransferase